MHLFNTSFHLQMGTFQKLEILASPENSICSQCWLVIAMFTTSWVEGQQPHSMAHAELASVAS